MDLLTVVCTIVACLLGTRTGSGQYLYRGGGKGGGSPVPSAPVADDTNPYVYNFNLRQDNIIAKRAWKGVHRSDCNQQRIQLSLPPEFPTPKPSAPYVPGRGYGSSSADPSPLKSETFGDFFVFVPAFPSSSLTEEGSDLIGAAPAPGGTVNSFVPPDGALLGPPAPIVDGTPLPAPRIIDCLPHHRQRLNQPTLYPYQ